MVGQVIIPAFEEAGRIGGVLQALTGLPAGWGILVVDDGSSDDTSVAASAFRGVTVHRLPVNRGKGAAMWEGALRAEAPVLVFLDADLTGLRAEHVLTLAELVLRGQAAMTVASFRHGRGKTDLSHRLAPWVSGQRAMRVVDFLSVPGIAQLRWGVEAHLTRVARDRSWAVLDVPWPGVSHATKEEKLGWLRGLAARREMYRQMARAWFRRRSHSGGASPPPAIRLR